MNITTPVIMPLDRAPAIQNVDAVQDDMGRHIAFHLYFACVPWEPPVGTTAMVHYTKPNGTSGSYDTLPDGNAACVIDGNVLTVALAPQICEEPGTVHLQVSLIQGEAQITTFCTHVRVYAGAGNVDWSEIRCPCVYARIVAQADNQSTVAVTVSGINEALVTGVSLEYVLRPTKNNEPVLVPIETGDYDLVNGHIYSTSVPVVSNFQYRGVLHYVGTDGNAQILEENWNVESSTMRSVWALEEA